MWPSGRPRSPRATCPKTQRAERRPARDTHRTSPILAKTRVREPCSGIDGLYLSGIGPPPVGLLDELDLLKEQAIENVAPVDSVLGGYPMKVVSTPMGKFGTAWFMSWPDLASCRAKSAQRSVSSRNRMLHGVGPEGTVAWVRGVLANAGIDVRQRPVMLQVARLDLHYDWQGLWIEAEERSHFVTYSDHRALFQVTEDRQG